MSPVRLRPRRVAAAGALSALLGTALTATALVPSTPLAAPPASAAAVCATEQSEGTFYPGANASRVYNNLFGISRSINRFLSTYTPQGLGVWPNWRGGEDLLVVGLHHRDENTNNSLIYGMTVGGGTYRGAAYLPKGAHAGGLKVYRNWLYVQQDTTTIRRYNLAHVKQSLLSPGTQNLGAGQVQKVYEVSTFDIDDGYLYGAKHNGEGRDWMRRWKINASGDLIRDYDWGPVQAPKRTQGVLVLRDTFIFSTAGPRDERGNIYVIRRGYTSNFEDRRYRCFQGPAMGQELVGFNGTTYLNFEGGAGEFADGSINKITNLHQVSTERLRSLVW